MATLCIRSTDCLAGRASFGAHRGVRAAPALAPRLPMQHESQTLATASPPHVAMNSRSARGRANGRQRRRRSPPAAGTGTGSPPHKRVMDNVVLLRRGQILMDKATAPLTATISAAGPSVAQAVAGEAETALAGKDTGAGVAAAVCRGEREKVEESVADAKQSNVKAERCETAAAVDQRGAQEEPETAVAVDNMATETKEEEPVVAMNQSGAETTKEDGPEAAASQSGAQVETAEPVAAVGKSVAQEETTKPVVAVDQRGPDAREKKAEAAEHRGADAMKSEPAPAAHQTLPLAKEAAEQAYAGASFVPVAPDPCALPIPVRLLKPRVGAARIRVHVHAPDTYRAPASWSCGMLEAKPGDESSS